MILRLLISYLLIFIPQGLGGKAGIGGKAGMSGGASVVNPTFVREVDDRSALTSTQAVTFSVNVVAGDTIICAASWLGNTITLTSIKDGTGASFTVIDTTQDTLNGGFQVTARLFNSTGGASASAITVIISGSTTGDLALECQEWTPATTVGANVGQQQQFPGTGANAVTSGSVTTSNTSGCAGFTVNVGGGGSLTAGTTIAWTSHANPGHGFYLNESFTQSSAGSIAATFTDGTGGGDVLITNIVCVN